MSITSRVLRRLATIAAGSCSMLLAQAGCAAAASPPAPAEELPPSIQSALRRVQLPPEALVVYVAEVGNGKPARLAWRAGEPVNPASLMKLYTTGVALEVLGPAWSWTTPVLVNGTVSDGVLQGDLILQGRGDPTLVVERLWLMLRQVQQRGIREVRGDILLDNSAFVLTGADAADPGEFDGERLRPYNVRPDALMLNLKALTLAFAPDVQRGVARVAADVPLAGVQIDATVPLSAGDCGDWRGGLRLDVTEPTRLRLIGTYPLACGEKSWPLAFAEPRSFNARLVDALWRETGARLTGRVREATTPAGAVPLFEFGSAPVASVIREINKFSNNVMAQQLFLTLGWQAGPALRAALATGAAQPLPPEVFVADADPALPPSQRLAGPTADAARELVRAQVKSRAGCADAELVVDNGSGLSRHSRSSARCMGQWLQALWSSPVMPELIGSLPVSGLDGTARRPGRSWGTALGRAHLKTGSLRDASGLAGYVLANSGRRYVFVAILNHPNALAGRPVLDALVQWAAEDSGR
ncbi:MAG TPA: D-alanyl-D-alanine carboxypeptidase [Methylibium sp.]|uniref:D-alanyl-D-alanine carboxypeptidase/D-alanyl-D-alanine-endopeptidase n=1 Tax=Methylibium sp. TaxID=2067992 RepID=UPI002DBD8418|nr:D-alanyl-D-alanine carboxypeptidase [Methylibium sp.]HEU4458738.1 D-alanyl-D-alanine carboxypeptidase [Methylibium sp.]